jgi:oxygen-independent coproporphyrinogen-3 oxidase
MMDQIPVVLGSSGFRRYEISNYALPGFESRHNSVYWDGGDYVGIGAGAHSYCQSFEGQRLCGAERWSTLANPQAYMTKVKNAGVVSWRESLDLNALQFEFFYLGLRRVGGVERDHFETRFGHSWDLSYGEVLHELRDEGFLAISQEGASFTSEGIKLSDSVFERLAGVQKR